MNDRTRPPLAGPDDPYITIREKDLRDAWLRLDAVGDPRTAHTLWQHLLGVTPSGEVHVHDYGAAKIPCSRPECRVTPSWREASRDLIARGDDTNDGLVPTHARRPDGSPADGGEAPSDRLSGSTRSHPSQPVLAVALAEALFMEGLSVRDDATREWITERDAVDRILDNRDVLAALHNTRTEPRDFPI